MKKVYVWTDGGGLNPGPCAAAAVLAVKGAVRVLGKALGHGTNNQAETAAVALALDAFKEPCRITLFTDSQYVLNGIRRLANGSMLKTNRSFWRNVKRALGVHDHYIKFRHVNGHSGNAGNELADTVASLCAKSQTNVDKWFSSIDVALDYYSGG